VKDAENFQKWAKSVVLFSHITSRVDGEKYPNLLSEKGGRGFPYCVFLDEEGNVLAKHEGPRTVEGFTKTANSVKSFLELKEKAASGDEGAKFDYLLARIELGHLSADDAKKECDGLKLTKVQSAKIEKALTNLMISDTIKGVRSKEAAVAAGKKFASLLAEEVTPADPNSNEWLSFMAYTMLYAEETGDPGLFEDAYGRFKEKHGQNRRYAKFLEKAEKRLEDLKGSDEDDPNDK